MFAKSDKQQYLISPQLDDSEPMKVTFWFRNSDSNSSVDFYVGYATEITESGRFRICGIYLCTALRTTICCNFHRFLFIRRRIIA